MTRKHFEHAARYVATFSKRGTKTRAAMIAVVRNLFATYNSRFDEGRFLAYIARLDTEAGL